MDEALRHLAIDRGVQLEKTWGVAELGRYFFQRIHRQRRDAHRHSGDCRGARGSEVAVFVDRAQADHPDRRHEYRRRPALAPQFDGQVPLSGADQHPRYQTPLLEGRDVGALCALITGATGDI
ncbi:hypothetical protein MHEL_07240 [Mycolicibacterium helvum]|uniref:Uncharacterized protein n=1 Tax=Mycolicibacterium helvum TaxID=1534349 RepID=A0A7I7T1T3_9MYCO|nr:hypothetical protein MHEL_07240 [Mycolicibacterium helvum]